MLKQTTASVLVSFLLLVPASNSLAKELLFQAEPANNDYARGVGKKLAEAYRTEFDPRMFPHRTWHQRLSYSSYNPDVDETVEIYSKPDGSRWLSHRRTSPSLTGFIWSRIVEEAKFDLKKKLDSVRITSHDVALPREVANDLELLWQTMLPGASEAQFPPILNIHAPIFDAWTRKHRLVETGRIKSAAYDTPVYRAFVDVVTDLRTVCDRGGGLADPVFARLPGKIRRLRSRLQ